MSRKFRSASFAALSASESSIARLEKYEEFLEDSRKADAEYSRKMGEEDITPEGWDYVDTSV